MERKTSTQVSRTNTTTNTDVETGEITTSEKIEDVKKTDEDVLKQKPDSDRFYRWTSFLFIVGIVVADYMGFTSQYSTVILGASASMYVFGRKGLEAFTSAWLKGIANAIASKK